MTAVSLKERDNTEINRQLDLELEGTFPGKRPVDNHSLSSQARHNENI